MSDADRLYLLTDAKRLRRIKRILMERRLTSHLNDIKWRELCRGVDQLPFRPAYQIKRVDVDAPEPLELPHAPAYLGDWARTPEASLGADIEWMKIAPRFAQHRGRLVEPMVWDCSEELIALLGRLRLQFEEQDGFIVLFGHSLATKTDAT